MAVGDADNSDKTRVPEHSEAEGLLDVSSESPRPVRRSARSIVLDVYVDVFLLALSLLFFASASLCDLTTRLRHKPIHVSLDH